MQKEFFCILNSEAVRHWPRDLQAHPCSSQSIRSNGPGYRSCGFGTTLISLAHPLLSLLWERHSVWNEASQSPHRLLPTSGMKSVIHYSASTHLSKPAQALT